MNPALAFIVTASFACSSPRAANAPIAETRPNIILVMTDDQGYGDVGHRDHAHLQTPTLDELASRALRFERFYAAAPVCSPTRASCLTGRHPYRLGITGANSGHMRDEELTLAESLKAHGYRTGHFGKWHLGTLTTEITDSNRGGPEHAGHFAPPWLHGFERCFSTEAKVPTYDPMITPPMWAGGVGKKEEGTPYGTAYWNERGEVVDEGLEGDDSRIIMDRALSFIDASVQRKDSFLAVIWLHAPHLPVLAGEDQLARYKSIEDREQRHYFACITSLDQQLGRLRAKLAQLDVAQDTMLWFCSDNGPEGAAGKAPGSAGGLRGRKRSLFDGGIRVPAYLEWPARFPEPRVIDAPCVTSDIVPTVLAALNIPLPERPLDGIDLAPLLDGEVTTRSRSIGFRSSKMAVWMEDRLKLVRSGQKVMLFDIPSDPSESSDLAQQDPESVQRLSAELDSWIQACDESRDGKDY
ncbi:MAG: arylsulfatase A-like enzyme [Planctomycetota bacterium]|jgi:arylsulfatase A-like enzyme